MTGTTEGKLEQAYELIRQERVEDAAAILQPILLNEPENADAWWLWANTVTEPEDARHALSQVLTYNPEHESAQSMLEQLNELYPAVPEAEADTFGFGEASDFDDLFGDTTDQEVPPPSPPETLPVELDDAAEDFAVDDFGGDDFALEPDFDEGPVIQPLNLDAVSTDTGEAVDMSGLFDDEGDFPDFGTDEDMPEAEAKPRRRSPLRMVLLLLLLIVVVLAFVVVGGGLLTSGPAPADSGPTDLQPSENVAAVLDAMSNTANAQQSVLGGTIQVTYESRDGGSAIILRVCRPAGADISTSMDVAMTLVARLSAPVQDEVALVGAQLVNCDRDDVLMGATVTSAQAAAFASTDLSEDAFRAAWQWEM